MVFGSNKKIEKKTKDFPIYLPPKKEEVVVEQPSSASFIGKTMKIEGELVSDEDLTIEGQVKGTIEVTKTLTIGKNGDVSADINARVVKIIGRARGNIVASDKVEILSNGRYNGNIMSEKLVVSEGAVLIGNINQETESVAKAETEPLADEAEKKKTQIPESKPSEPETEPGPEPQTESRVENDAEVEEKEKMETQDTEDSREEEKTDSNKTEVEK
jgi:cytoskeletal protein CcmA (bactofilin family)